MADESAGVSKTMKASRMRCALAAVPIIVTVACSTAAVQ
jgi:hypothetical protein